MAKGILTSFSPITSTNVGIIRQTSVTVSFNTFPTLVENVKAITCASLESLNLNQERPSKKFEIMIIIFSHRDARVIKL